MYNSDLPRGHCSHLIPSNLRLAPVRVSRGSDNEEASCREGTGGEGTHFGSSIYHKKSFERKMFQERLNVLIA